MLLFDNIKHNRDVHYYKYLEAIKKSIKYIYEYFDVFIYAW